MAIIHKQLGDGTKWSYDDGKSMLTQASTIAELETWLQERNLSITEAKLTRKHSIAWTYGIKWVVTLSDGTHTYKGASDSLDQAIFEAKLQYTCPIDVSDLPY